MASGIGVRWDWVTYQVTDTHQYLPVYTTPFSFIIIITFIISCPKVIAVMHAVKKKIASESREAPCFTKTWHS